MPPTVNGTHVQFLNDYSHIVAFLGNAAECPLQL